MCRPGYQLHNHCFIQRNFGYDHTHNVVICKVYSYILTDFLSIAYTYTHTAAPPAPLFSEFSYTFSLRDGELSLNLTWDETFTTTHAVQMYRVRSDLCPEQCVETDTPFSCPGLVAGGEYMFWVRAVNCGDQEGEESQPLVARLQGTRLI